MSGAAEAQGAFRIALSNLGCRVNRVELDVIARSLSDAGCELVSERDAELVVINSCAVTGEAQAKTRKAVRHAARLPQSPTVVVTGCVASLFPDELLAIGPNVLIERDKPAVARRALEAVRLRREHLGQAVGTREIQSIPLDTARYRGRTRPGIKIQDGCDNHCTFCIVWKARGRSRSMETSQVLQEVREAQARGAHEVVLTGINLGNFRGVTQSGGAIALPGLLQEILEKTDVERVRLSSIEPPDVTEELLSVMAAAGERVAPFLHVCLQSGCDRTLREMGRVYDTAQYALMAERAYATVPGLTLGTDLIVGFPGETDDDFEASMGFCERMRFSRMHIFRYSKRPGTPAAAREDQVDPHVIAARSERMLQLAHDMRVACAREHLDREELVVVQYPGRGVSGGLFDVLVDETYEVDELVRVRVRSVRDDGTLDARSR